MGQGSTRGMDDGGGDPDERSDDTTCLPQQDMLNGEEGLSEEEKNKRRAERRRAKRKRQRERKKLEKEGRSEYTEQEQEEGREVLESDNEEEDEDEDEEEEEEEEIVLPQSNKHTPSLATRRNKSNLSHSLVHLSDEEPEWDVSCAFVANAASHIRPRGRAGHGSRHNKENEARQQAEKINPVKQRGASLTEQGIELFKLRKYTQAVDMFTAAIQCDPRDHRFFGNRSYCYWFLELYPSALSDAEKSIQLAPDWPKGHFRKGSALMGMKRYGEAEKAMQEVLRLDERCKEASSKLLTCQVLQLMDFGFKEEESVLLLKKFHTVETALASTGADRVMEHTSSLNPSGTPCPSLWVGNVTADVTETHIRDLFKLCGDIESIRLLHERFCAFVNFRNANMAAKALEKLQGVELGNSRLVIRYPDRWMQRTNPGLNNSSTTHCPLVATGSGRLAPVNGDQCYFWRSTGCIYGDKCRFKHIPDQRGRNKII